MMLTYHSLPWLVQPLLALLRAHYPVLPGMGDPYPN
jgi:hypothetical protein